MLKKPKARYLHVSPPFSGLDHEDAEEAESTLFTRLPPFSGLDHEDAEEAESTLFTRLPPLFRGLVMKMLKEARARYLQVSPPFFGAWS